MIDPETCDICVDCGNVKDPYDLGRPDYALIGNLTFVSSEESKGWVFAEDLPADKRRAVYDRIEAEVIHIERGDEKPKDGLDKLPWDD